MTLHDAIYKLNPTVVTIEGETAYDAQGNAVTYNMVEAQALTDANAYKKQRVAEYPSIGEQLDALFHAGVFPSDMADKIQAVKDKYPKV